MVNKYVHFIQFYFIFLIISASGTPMCDESYNELQQGGVCLIKTKQTKSFFFVLSIFSSPMVRLLSEKH